MKKILKLSAMVVTLLMFVAACSTSPKTQVVQLGDNSMSKEQIIAEMAKLDNMQKEVESKKGMTGTNIASVLLWWPGIAYTYYDAAEANKLIQERRSHLMSIYNRKYGGTPVNANA